MAEPDPDLATASPEPSPKRDRNAWVDAAARTLVRELLVLVWPALLAVCLGATLWALAFPGRLADMASNSLSVAERMWATSTFALGGALVLAAYVAMASRHQRHHGRYPTLAELTPWHGRLGFVLAGPCVVALCQPGIESTAPFFCAALIFVAAAACAWSAWTWAGPRIDRPPKPVAAWHGFATAALLLGLFAAYVARLATLALNQHHSLRTLLFDLGIYDNIFYQSIHGRPLACSFLLGGTHATAHFDPILVLLSPLYLLYPRAELLLVLQTLWCGAGVWAAYLVGRRLIGGRVAGLAWAACWALCPALHGANLYDFHSLTLLATPLLFALYFLETERLVAYALLLPVLLLIREDVALLMCCVGVHALCSERPRLVRMGLVTLAASVVYFVGVRLVLYASHVAADDAPGSYSYFYYYEALDPHHQGLAGMAATVLTNPVFVLRQILQEPKVWYLVMLLLPLGFLPLAAKRGLWLVVYGLAFSLLATREAVYSIHFQYAVVLFPMLFLLAAAGVARLRQRWGDRVVPAALVGALVASVLCACKFGALCPNDSLRAGYNAVAWQQDSDDVARYNDLRALVAEMSPQASVSVSDRVGPHVTNRAKVFRLMDGVASDYVLLDVRDLDADDRRVLDPWIAQGHIALLAERRELQLWRRRGVRSRALLPADPTR